MNCPEVSAIICTRDRVSDLEDALGSLLQQAYPTDAYEVLVVDNGTTTCEQVQALIGKAQSSSDVAIRYVREPVAGLSRARNTGARHARADIVAYMDDDAMAESGWVAALAEVYQTEPRATSVGGPVRMVWVTPRPAWFAEELLPIMGQRELGENRLILSYPQCPNGSNFSLRRDVLEAIGWFPVNLGFTGKHLLPGEEVAVCQRLHHLGAKLVYEPAAIMWHKVRGDALDPRYLRRRAFWQGVGAALARTYAEGGLISRRQRFYEAAYIIWQALRSATAVVSTRRRSPAQSLWWQCVLVRQVGAGWMALREGMLGAAIRPPPASGIKDLPLLFSHEPDEVDVS